MLYHALVVLHQIEYHIVFKNNEFIKFTIIILGNMSELVPPTISSFIWDVFRATMEVNNWYNLGLQLGFLEDELNTIQKMSYNNTAKAKLELFAKWEDAGSASWENMIIALRAIGHHIISATLSQKYDYGKLHN